MDPGTISIEVRNFTAEKARIHLQLKQNDTVQYTKTTTLAPDGGTRLKNVVDGGEYQLEISTDKYGEVETSLTMNDCDEQEVSVVILKSGRIDVQMKTC